MGHEDAFNAANLSADVRFTVVENLGLPPPFVLVGHSMGGRVAMQYGADYPQDLCGLVIEDMDVQPRRATFFTPDDLEERRAFSRQHDSWESLKASLSRWYDPDRIDGWRNDGRLFKQQDDRWYSGINPMAHYLAMVNVLGERGVGMDQWLKLKSIDAPLHCFVAGLHSAVDRASLDKMTESLSSTVVTHFPKDSHSIHSTNSDNMFDLRMAEIMETAKQTSAGTPHSVSSIEASHLATKQIITPAPTPPPP